MSYLIFDIETVPDSTLWSPAPPKPRARTKKDEFAPLYAHRPICIGYVQLSDEFDVQNIGVAGTTSFGDDEARLIQSWSMWMHQLQPVLVSFNGRGFDMPVLSLRALRHGISLQWHDKGYRSKYGEQHVDLLDHATEYGAVQRSGFSLSNLSALIGLPTKGDMDGSKVAGMFAAGEAAKIESYCTMDVARTAFLFMRYSLMRGRMSLERYREVSQLLMAACIEKGLNGLLFGADEKRLLLAAE